MTEREINEFYERINKLKEMGISLPKEMTPESKIRGVYGFFAKNKGNNDVCFYIGKSINIFIRILGKNSHLNDYLRGDFKTEVTKNINEYLKSGFNVEIRILKEVKYIGDSFEKDANRLALAELQELVKHQNIGGCQKQLSEAVKEKYERIEWENKYSTVTEKQGENKVNISSI